MQYDGSPILVVLATLNEEEGVGPTIADINNVLHDSYVLVVDGRSVDRTVEVAKNFGAEVIFQEGKGKGEALFQGIKKLGNVKYVVFVDADFTYPAMYIPYMIQILEKSPEVGMVIGNRFDSRFDNRKVMPGLFYFGNRLLALTQNLMNGVKLDDPLSGLRVVRSEILKGWIPKSMGFDIEAEMNHYVERKGYQIVEIPIEYRKRFGEKKLKWTHGLTIFNRIIAGSITSYLNQ